MQNKWINRTEQKQIHGYKKQVDGCQSGGTWGMDEIKNKNTLDHRTTTTKHKTKQTKNNCILPVMFKVRKLLHLLITAWFFNFLEIFYFLIALPPPITACISHSHCRIEIIFNCTPVLTFPFFFSIGSFSLFIKTYIF